MYLKKYIGLTGGELIYNQLLKHNVKNVFGVIGGCNMPLLDAFGKNNKIKFISTNHEQNAGHMAQGVARTSKQPGIVFGTSGPGSTNLITPLQDAMLDSTPIIAFTGQVKSHLLNTDAFQECNIIEMTKSCTKWNYQITNINEIIPIMDTAFQIAKMNRPGPVLIDVCKDVSMETFSFLNAITKINYNFVNSQNKQNCDNELLSAAKLINNAQQPILYCGQGALHAFKEVRQLSKIANIPVTTTLLGLGTVNENDPLSLNMLGMHGSVSANKSMQQSDLVIAIGARFDDRVTADLNKFIPNAKLASKNKTGGVIHIDVSNKEINKLVNVDVALTGDSKIILNQLLPLIKNNKNDDWITKINGWKTTYPFSYKKTYDDDIIKPQQVIQELYNQTKNKKIIITTGVGQHQMWAAQYYNFTKPFTMVTSGGLGTMGFGLPAAIGAKVANPDFEVIDIDGDGSFNMTLTEMMTAVKNNINIKVIILNNNSLGMVKQWQDIYYDSRYITTTNINSIDYMKFSESVGCVGLRCTKQSSIKSTINKLLNTNGPTICEFIVSNKEHCLPMVESHKALDDMIMCEK
jgi:acetolactate synthase-1/2/3 large subunit